MKEVTLAATARAKTGKGAARQSRMAGNIPGVVYGPEIDPYSVEVNERDLRAAVKEASTSAIFDLSIDGSVTKVVIRDIQRDPVTSKVTHLDFHAISMNRPLHITVPIHFIGTAIGVKSDSGILQTIIRELNISCLPKDIPDSVDIDVSELAVGDSIHVSELEVPNAKILTEGRRTVVVVAAPTVVTETVSTAEGEELEGEEGAAEGEAAEGEASEGDAKAKEE